MAAYLRPIQKLAKVAYKILKTPKDLQQKNQRIPNEKRVASWKVDVSTNS